jgi:hypothetical protein
MPAGNRTGPWGAGPRTGRGLGYCSGFQAPGFMFPGPGLGFGRGFGLGRGFGRGMGLGRGRGVWRSRFGEFYGHPYFPTASYPYSFGAGPYFMSPHAYFGQTYGPPYPGPWPYQAPEQPD